MPTKRLPAKPDIKHLKYQAKDLLANQRAGELEAFQRIREFHPRFETAEDSEIGSTTLTLADAYLAVAREYGFKSWARLETHVTNADDSSLDTAHHERIENPIFRRAVDLLDDGDVDGLRKHLADYPNLVRERVTFEGGNYFRNPTLLEFVAENPVRHDSLPPNIVAIAELILDAGAKSDQRGVVSTLELVSSGRVARECEVQIPLIDLLCSYGADPNAAMPAALGNRELDAAEALIRRGATVDLEAAAATGHSETARRLLPAADKGQRHRALALSSQYGHLDIVRLLLDAGENPDRYNPVGCHAHSTPLHQAALAGHRDVVRLLVERGARLEIKDIHYRGTPLEWAEFGGHAEVAEYLRSRGGDARVGSPRMSSVQRAAAELTSSTDASPVERGVRERRTMLDSSASRWRFWLLWVAVSAAGGAAVTTLARAAASAVGDTAHGAMDGPHLGGIAGDEAILAVALAGFMTGIGTAQWLVIRRQVPWAGGWLLGNAGGGAAAAAVTFGVAMALGGFEIPAASNSGVVLGMAALGTAHWLVLRRQVARAPWLAFGAVAGLIGAAVGGGVVGELVGGQISAGGGFGAGYGAVTGAAVVLVRSRAAASTPL